MISPTSHSIKIHREEHEKRAFLSTEHTFAPKTRKSLDSVRSERPASPARSASVIKGSTHSASVKAVLEESKAKLLQRADRAGSPLLSAMRTARSSKDSLEGSRVESLYKHGVQRGLDRLSAQARNRTPHHPSLPTS